MPEIDEKEEISSQACGCASTMFEMASACCGGSAGSNAHGSEETDTTPDEGGA
jgi:hypothetical protein